MRIYVVFIVVMILFMANFVMAATYIDASLTNTTLADGTALQVVTTVVNPEDITSNSSPATNNNRWHLRTALGNGGNVFASAAGSDSPLLRTRLSGLLPDSNYDIFVYYWVAGQPAPSGNNCWDIAAGLTTEAVNSYLWNQGAKIEQASYFGNEVMVVEGNRALYEISLGSVKADANGQILVYVDDFPDNPNRTWYDGVAYKKTGAYCSELPVADFNQDCKVDVIDLGIMLDSWLASDADLVAGAGEGFANITDDGAWCWFADPRAIYYQGQYRKTYIGWVNSRGDIVIASYNHDTDQTDYYTLHPHLQVNDHCNPAIMIKPDGRLMVYYSAHSGSRMYLRESVNPEDISLWTAERALALNNTTWGYTYPNPTCLSAENNRIYLFWRGDNWNPAISWSDDMGQNWQTSQNLVLNPSQRPYLKKTSNNIDKIHFAFNDGHPRNVATNSIYYMYYHNNEFFKADGTKITDLDSLPIAPRDADVVYDGRITNIRSWIWDIAFDANDYPVIVYATFPATNDHRYRYARWDGTQWLDNEITAGGPWFPQTPVGTTEPEPHYSGGIALDHSNTSIVYLSRRINGNFEIEKWATADNGLSWSSQAITKDSTMLNVRPFVAHNHLPDESGLFWMNGSYTFYTNYNTAIKMHRRNLDADLNGDGIINLEDFAILAGHWLESNIVVNAGCFF